MMVRHVKCSVLISRPLRSEKYISIFPKFGFMPEIAFTFHQNFLFSWGFCDSCGSSPNSSPAQILPWLQFRCSLFPFLMLFFFSLFIAFIFFSFFLLLYNLFSLVLFSLFMFISLFSRYPSCLFLLILFFFCICFLF